MFKRNMTLQSVSVPKKFWIKDAIKKPGALHKSLKVPAGKKIPKAKIKKAEHSKNPLLAKRARLADTLGKMNKGK